MTASATRKVVLKAAGFITAGVLLLASHPARADAFTERAAAAKDQIYVATPALTQESCEALVEASARNIHIWLLIQRRKGFACDAHTATRIALYMLDHVPTTFAFFDHRYAGEGPDIAHLAFAYDPQLASGLFSKFWDEAIHSPEFLQMQKPEAEK